MSFSSLGLSDSLLRALNELGYETATPIQEKAIPLVLKGGDLLAAAQTGSGKTAAFVLPILQRFAESKDSSEVAPALILVPTHELAIQVGASIERYSKDLEKQPRTLVAFGGGSIDAQIKTAREGVDFVVATPGRLLDLVERGDLSLPTIGVLVLDEADRLLALGFTDELNAILDLLPAERQNLLFSATFPPAVVSMA
ncbi:MAG: DEAD/DEAH box helicase, partial [Opitutaceae bacterium]|nr:DEAD/DEAH box helicase [Opitutaceae bacterium]